MSNVWDSLEAIAPDWRSMPALAVRQPWATAILNGKDVENRIWKDWYRNLQLGILARAGNRFLLHASKGFKGEDLLKFQDLVEERQIPAAWAMRMKLRDMPRGGIIGVATAGGWVTTHSSPWFTGTGAIVIEHITPVPFVPCRGALGFFFPNFSRAFAPSAIELAETAGAHLGQETDGQLSIDLACA